MKPTDLKMEISRNSILEETCDYLSRAIPDNCLGKNEVILLCKWIIQWNKLLPENQKIIGYKRDYGEKNIGFTYETHKYKKKKPEILIIKLPGTDIVDFPDELILDFYLPKAATDNFKNFIKPCLHSSYQTRWVLHAKDINRMGISEVKDLITLAHQLRMKGGH